MTTAGEGCEGPASADFLDLRFDTVDEARAVTMIAARAPDAPFAYVVTPNVDHVVRLHHYRSDLWPVYRRAWLTLCDSRILAGLARRAGLRLPVVPGSDLTQRMVRHAIAPGDRIAILGGGASIVEELRAVYGFRDIVHYDPPMGFVRDPAEVARAAEFLIEARARYSFLAVGSPQQETVARHVERSGRAVGTGLCIGASLDFLVGRQTRAPRLMQRMGMEWLFRLLSSPRRMWRRYLVDGPAIFALFTAWRRARTLP
jgi:exopolysaccharide biosynthesis WecB/TagA/CpsF family protein